jgi:hypothetical protein
LIDLAKSKGLDPFVASTWKKLTTTDIVAAKVCIPFLWCWTKKCCSDFTTKGGGMLHVLPYRQVIADAFPEVC